MVHQGQRLSLGFKAGHDTLSVHAQLDDFERHEAADGLVLLGQVNHTTAAFTNRLQQFVVADFVAGFFEGHPAWQRGSLCG